MLTFVRSAQEAQEYWVSAGIPAGTVSKLGNELEVVDSAADAVNHGLNLFNKGSKRTLLVRENPYKKGEVKIFGFLPESLVKSIMGVLNARFGGFKVKSLEALADAAVAKAQRINTAALAALEEARFSIVASQVEVEAAEEVAKAVAEAEVAEAEVAEAETIMVEAEAAIADAEESLRIEEHNFTFFFEDSKPRVGLMSLDRQGQLAGSIDKLSKDIAVAEKTARENRSLKESLEEKIAGLRKDLASLDVVKFSREAADKFIRNELIKPVKAVRKQVAQRKQCSNKGITLEMVETLVKEEQAFSRRAWLKELREARKQRDKALHEAKASHK